jgi:predicted ribosome quality control (RQC) complex YloA/Tae2 family protein
MQKMSSLDLYFVVQELARLQGARIKKIRKTEEGFYLFKIGDEEILVEPAVRIHLTRIKYTATEKPDGFVSFLRKNLEGKIVESITQHENDRIVEIQTKNKDKIIFELFRKGNIIYVNSDGIIEACKVIEKVANRTIANGEEYVYPPKTNFQMTFPSKIGFCAKEQEWFSINADDVEKGGKVFPTFSEALDYYYSSLKRENEKEKEIKKKIEKIENRLKIQREALENLEKQKDELKKKAELIYKNYALVEEVLGKVKEMKKNGLNEKEINKEIEKYKAKLTGSELEIELE